MADVISLADFRNTKKNSVMSAEDLKRIAEEDAEDDKVPARPLRFTATDGMTPEVAGAIVNFAKAKVAEISALAISATRNVTTITEAGVERFNYAGMLQRAMWRLVQETLEEVIERGLPQNSVLMLNIRTNHPGVAISDRLKAMWPTSVMVKLDAWWENLTVNDKGFAITLNFGDVRERLGVPYEALISFDDTFSGFGLMFTAAMTNEQQPTPPSVA